MGFHTCEFCFPDAVRRFSNLSSGDVTLLFDNGHAYEMPDMILHYVADHHWQPPQKFIDDVMNHVLVGGERLQTKSPATRIAYLSGKFETGEVPAGFLEKLEKMMQMADLMGQRVQYRSLR